MSLENVQPESTLAIVLGASEWPLSPKLPKSKAFANSAKGFSIFLTAREGFNLPTKNLLNLFDAGDAPNEINSSISTFLVKRQEELQKAGTPAKDVIAYYVGHGGFTPGEQKYFLAVRTTQEDSEGASSIRMSDFARTLKQKAKNLRRYLILDCCFAAAAYGDLQGTGTVEATREKTLSEFPKKGTALLCASSSHDVAIAPPDDEHTMFSGALLDVLTHGDSKLDFRLSLEQLGEQVKRRVSTTLRHMLTEFSEFFHLSWTVC